MGCSGCTPTPRSEKKIRRNLQGKFVSAPQDILLCGEDLKLQLDRLLKATKKVVNFLRKKVHPRQNPGYAYAVAFDCP